MESSYNHNEGSASLYMLVNSDCPNLLQLIQIIKIDNYIKCILCLTDYVTE